MKLKLFSLMASLLVFASIHGCCSVSAMEKVWSVTLSPKETATAIAFSPRGNRLVVGASSGEMAIFGTVADKAAEWSDKPLFKGKVTDGSAITALAFDPAQKILAIGAANGMLHFGSNTGVILKELKFAAPIKQIVFSDDGNKVLVLCDSNIIKIVNFPDFSVTEYSYKYFRPSAVAFGASNNEIIEGLANARGEIVKGNIEKKRATLKVYAQQFGIAAMAVNAAHNVIATSGADAAINFWNMEDLQFVSKIETTDTFKKLAMDSNAQNVFGLCADGSLKIFETVDNAQIGALYYGVLSQALTVKPDAKLVAVAFANGEVNVFSY